MKAFRTAHPQLAAHLFILLGTGLLAVSVQYFFDPAGLVTGGFTGLAIIIKALTGRFFEGGVPLWVSNLALNVPVFVLAYLLLGRKFVGRTLFGAVMLSVWLALLPAPFIQPKDLLLAAVFGGIISGAGVGLVFLGSATTGGTDLVAALIHKGLRHYSLASILMILDGAVVLVGLTVFGLRPALYAIITIYTATKVTDALLEGLKVSKAAYIISEKATEIAAEIMEKLDRGATGFPAVGMYTGKEKLIVYCVVSRKEIVQVKDIAAKYDPSAFVIVSDVKEVLGEGFQERGGALD
ncbi:MAG: YitT family protein [Oscillospiraceae bacterium]|nr:YitT family protein [Oscillospiraceae bacterium]